ncbi:MAG: hypothetical protein ACRCXT_05450, partial [Paraclostridium sp.]
MSIYDKESDTLYTRMTKFANPFNQEETVKKNLFTQIKQAILNQNINNLCILLGVKHQGTINQSMMSYNIKSFNNQYFPEDLFKKHFKINSTTYSIDLDTSRVLTITPVLHLRRKAEFLGEVSKDDIIYIDKQIEIPADGTGEIGEKNQLYVNLIALSLKK